ncbi:hypothetical protein [Streptomyces justiciae]|uniref:Transposase n=1 Tax=Streptomyces justiciae TaxID=2780140 RepID=A0ABU3M765_9ACTN|nr:hypothetical protein [Streptomyces justiciae]MDT7847349.1 hypothetical protein [Streptomyces justiciae]
MNRRLEHLTEQEQEIQSQIRRSIVDRGHSQCAWEKRWARAARHQ